MQMLHAQHVTTRSFEVLTGVKMSLLVFWVVTLCGLVPTLQCYNPEDQMSIITSHFTPN